MNDLDAMALPSGLEDPTLAEILAEITDKLNAGGHVELTEYAARCPGREAQLRTLVEALCLVKGAGESIPAPADEEPISRTLGDYRIIREVGRGGMGIVYEAEQISLGRRVALKVLPFAATMDPKQLQRFQNEARAAASLHHEHIVPVYAVGCERAVHFYAMQFLEGITLARAIRNGHRQPTSAGSDAPTLPVAGLSTEGNLHGPGFHRAAARLIAKAAEALEHAHSLGVVHRDVKPANLMIDVTGKVWVADFGLARFGADAGITMSGDVLGTLRYMSPEQALAKHGLVDHRTDIYALGATLYEVLTGCPALEGEDRQEVLRRIAFEEPVPPRKLDRTIPLDLENIVMKCLAKEPAQRYATAQELSDDLHRWLEGRPVVARPMSRAQRLAKWVRRRPTQAALYGVLILGACIGLTAALWFSARMGEARGALKKETFSGLLRSAEGRRLVRKSGWTWDNLDDLRKAAKLNPAQEQLLELRSEAASALGSVDLRFLGSVAEDFEADCIAFHPDGHLLALGQFKSLDDKTCSVLIVDIHGREPTRRLTFPAQMVNHPQRGLVSDGLRSLAVSPDGRWLVAGTRSGRILTWELARGDEPTACWQAHNDNINFLAFSRDGSAILSVSSDDMWVKRWSAFPSPLCPPTPLATWHSPSGRIEGFAIHPTEDWLACGNSGIVHYLASDTLRPVWLPSKKPAANICLHPNGLISLANWPSGIYLDDARGSGGGIHIMEQVDDDEVHRLAFDPDGSLLATASESSKHVRLWEVAGGKLAVDIFVGGGKVRPAFSPDGRILAITAAGHTSLYEIGGPRGQTFVAQLPRPIIAFALHPDGRRLVCLSRGSPRDAGIHTYEWPLDFKPIARPSNRRDVAVEPQNFAFGIQFQPGTSTFTILGAKSLDWIGSLGPADRQPMPDLREPAISFAPDGRLWGAIGDEIRVWDGFERLVTSRKNELGGKADALTNFFSISAGRTWTVAGGRDGNLHLLRGSDAKTEWLQDLAQAPLRSVALNPDETVAAAGSDRGELRLVRIPSRETAIALTPHDDRIVALSWSNGGLLASGSRDRKVKLWRWKDDTLEELLTLQLPAPVDWVAFHADGVRLFVLLKGERALRVWHFDRLFGNLSELGLGEGLGIIEAAVLPPAAPRPRPLMIPPNGPNGLRTELFADANFGQCVMVNYNPQILIKPESPIEPPAPGGLYTIRWYGWLKAPHPGKYTLYLCGTGRSRLWLDGVLRIDRWRVGESGTAQSEVELGERPHAIRVEYLGFGEAPPFALEWHTPEISRKSVPEFALFHDYAAATVSRYLYGGQRGAVNRLQFSKDAQTLFVAYDDYKVLLFDLATGTAKKTLNGHKLGIRGLERSADGRRIVTGSIDRTIRLWDASAGTELDQVNATLQVNAMALSADGKFLVAGGLGSWIGSSLKSFSVSGDRLIPLDRFNRNIGIVVDTVLTPDASVLSTITKQGDIQFWDVATGRELPGLNVSFKAARAAFSPDGHILVTGDFDGTVRFWRFPERTLIAERKPFKGKTGGLVFSADGKKLLVATANNLTLWDVAKWTQIAVHNMPESFGRALIHSPAFIPSSNDVIYGCEDGSVRFWTPEETPASQK